MVWVAVWVRVVWVVVMFWLVLVWVVIVCIGVPFLCVGGYCSFFGGWGGVWGVV